MTDINREFRYEPYHGPGYPGQRPKNLTYGRPVEAAAAAPDPARRRSSPGLDGRRHGLLAAELESASKVAQRDRLKLLRSGALRAGGKPQNNGGVFTGAARNAPNSTRPASKGSRTPKRW